MSATSAAPEAPVSQARYSGTNFRPDYSRPSPRPSSRIIAKCIVAVIVVAVIVVWASREYLVQKRNARINAAARDFELVGLSIKYAPSHEIAVIRDSYVMGTIPEKFLVVEPSEKKFDPDLRSRDYLTAFDHLERLKVHVTAFSLPEFRLNDEAARYSGEILFEKLSRYQPHIKVLHLSGYEIANSKSGGNDGHFCFSSFPELASIRIEKNFVGEKILNHLRGCRNLQEISIGPPVEGAGRLTAEGLSYIPEYCKIKTLSLSGINMTSPQLRALQKDSLTSLQTLVLTDSLIGDEGIEALSVAQNLETLVLDKCPLSDVGLAKLTPALLPKLKTISLRNTSATEDGRSRSLIKHVFVGP